MTETEAFVDWRATFDCAPDERTRWIDQFEQKGFAVWLAALHRFMAQNIGAQNARS